MSVYKFIKQLGIDQDPNAEPEFKQRLNKVKSYYDRLGGGHHTSHWWALDPRDQEKLFKPEELTDMIKMGGDETLARAAISLTKNPNDYVLAAQHPVSDVASTVLDKKDIPVAAFEALAKHHKPNVRRQLAKHPDIPEHISEALSDDPSHHVRAEIAANKATPRHVLRKLLKDTGQFVAVNAMENPSIDPKDLVGLHKSKVAAVRRSVASNPALHPDLLHELSFDKAAGVRAEVAANPSTRSETIHHMIDNNRHHEPAVRLGMVSNPKLTAEHFTKLYGDQIPSTITTNEVHQIVKHPNALMHHLDQIIDLPGKKYKYSKASISKRQDIGPDMLHKLSLLRDEPENIQRIAAHPKTSPKTLDRLAGLTPVTAWWSPTGELYDIPKTHHDVIAARPETMPQSLIKMTKFIRRRLQENPLLDVIENHPNADARVKRTVADTRRDIRSFNERYRIGKQ